VSTILPSSLVGCPLYLHVASAASYVRVDAYEYELHAQTRTAGVAVEVGAKRKAVASITDEMEDTEEAKQPRLEATGEECKESAAESESVVSFNADSPEVKSEANGSSLEGASSENASESVAPMVIDSDPIVADTNASSSSSSGEASLQPPAERMEDVHVMAPTSIEEPMADVMHLCAIPSYAPLDSSSSVASSEWNLSDLVLLLLLICLLSVISAQALAVVCQHVMA
jgi:hypothetical protein